MITPPPNPPARPQRRSHALMWVVLVAIAAAVVVAVTFGARPAGVLLAVEVAVLAVVRAVAPRPGPYGISARSRWFDVAFLGAGAAAIATLVLTVDAVNL